MKQLQNKTETLAAKSEKENNCPHPFLRSKKNTGEKVCVQCGRTIYLVKKK